MRTAIMILSGLALIALGISAIVKRSITLGLFGPVDSQEHKGAGAIILGIVLILAGIGLIVGEIVMASNS